MQDNLILKKDNLFQSRINTRIKREFSSLAKSKGLSASEYFNRLVLKELKREGVSIKVDLITG